LDELPKGFNVLLGSMSLVGTRAPSVEEWEKYEFRHRARLSCKPGITGLWQASGKSRTMSFEEATVMDTEYIMNWSLGLDWRILFKTATLKQ
jgi:lipopolysaccharide/colanic/teichoic acid biosynthesis glycosyltransferase